VAALGRKCRAAVSSDAVKGYWNNWETGDTSVRIDWEESMDSGRHRHAQFDLPAHLRVGILFNVAPRRVLQHRSIAIGVQESRTLHVPVWVER